MEGSKGSNNIIVIWMTIVRGDVMRSINPRAKAKNVQNVKLVRGRRLDLPRVKVETGSEISQMRQTSWGDRDPSNYSRNSAEKISSCLSRCLAWCCFYSFFGVSQAVKGEKVSQGSEGWFLFSVQCPWWASVDL